MPLYALVCHDKEDGFETRMGARSEHLAWVGENVGPIKVAGPMLDEAGRMAGSLFILELPDKAAVEAFNAADPYTRAGLWGRVDVREFKATFGQL
jgi:uncharacterized protein YciI